MTSLRDLFKKTKEAYVSIEKEIKDNYPKSKENLLKELNDIPDKILDADLEETAKKTIKITGTIINKFFKALAKLIFGGIFIFVLSYIIYSSLYFPYWCEKTYIEKIDNADADIWSSIKINKLGRDFVNLREKWFDRGCHNHDKIYGFTDEDIRKIDFFGGNGGYSYWNGIFNNIHYELFNKSDSITSKAQIKKDTKKKKLNSFELPDFYKSLQLPNFNSKLGNNTLKNNNNLSSDYSGLSQNKLSDSSTSTSIKPNIIFDTPTSNFFEPDMSEYDSLGFDSSRDMIPQFTPDTGKGWSSSKPFTEPYIEGTGLNYNEQFWFD